MYELLRMGSPNKSSIYPDGFQRHPNLNYILYDLSPRKRDLAALLDCLAASDLMGLGCSFGSAGLQQPAGWLQLAFYDFGGLHLTSASDAGAAIISIPNPVTLSKAALVATTVHKRIR